MVTISASVGQGGSNVNSDVLKIQQALNKIPKSKGGPDPKLKEDGWIGPKTIGAITNFQKSNTGLPVDGRIDVNGPTLARINALLNQPGPTPAPPVVNFTDQNLYGPGGPNQNDIKQDAFGDCYFVATLGSIAMAHPQWIRDAIFYHAASHQFRVRLYDTNGRLKYIWVTQAELEDNVKRRGGSWVDNNGKYERTWPAVMETAYAKMFDSDPRDGLGQGYQAIIQGGWAADATLAVTGNTGTQMLYQHYSLLGTSGSVYLLGQRVSVALQQGRAVSLSTDPEADTRSLWGRLTGAPIAQDGLVDNHVYTVLSIARAGTDWNVRVRNPWANNNNVGEGMDTPNAEITISLRTLVDTRGLEEFRAR